MLSPRLLGSVLEAAPDAIVIIDALCGDILFANRQVLALFGYTPEEITGRSIEQLMPGRFGERHVEHRKKYAQNLRLRPMGLGLDLFARRKDGSEFPVEISLSPIRDKERALVAAAIRDITERKNAQTELMVARESAERANQAKSRFLATASHDLRQPLQSLALLNGSLQRIVTDPTVEEAITQQAQAIDAMSRLLNALLDISKLESGAIQPEPAHFPVATLFEKLRQEFASVAMSKGIELCIDAPAVNAHSDPALVGQVLRNLLSNAIKYTHKGRVCLRAKARRSTIHIEVSDTGIGIAADQLPFIYDEFYQVGVSSHASREGYGLGLSIVSRLASLLNLRLQVQSEPGRGSSFAFELPRPVSPTLSVETSPANASTSGRATRQGRGHILLVEDDPAVRKATRFLLSVAGYDVTVAESLGDALRKAQDKPHLELLVTDYHLGGNETGLQVILALREALAPRLPAILVTGDTSSVIRQLPEDESVRVASKPIEAESLLALITALLPGQEPVAGA